MDMALHEAIGPTVANGITIIQLIILYIYLLLTVQLFLAQPQPLEGTQKNRNIQNALKEHNPERKRRSEYQIYTHVRNTATQIARTSWTYLNMIGRKIVPSRLARWWGKPSRPRTRTASTSTKKRSRIGKSPRAYRMKDIRWSRYRRAYVVTVTLLASTVQVAREIQGAATSTKPRGIPHKADDPVNPSEGGPDKTLHKHGEEILLCHHTTIMSTTEGKEEIDHIDSIMRFDTDSVPIKVDNCCTRTISFCRDDFIEETLTPVENKVVKSFSGTLTPITHQGTIRWWVTDDDGVSRHIIVPGSYLVPEGTTRLLSPQHWAQQVNDNSPIKRGTWCATYDDEITIQWNQREFQKTIKIDPNTTNVATMWTAPGYHKYDKFLDEASTTEAMAMVFSTEITIDEVLPEIKYDNSDEDGIPLEGADEMKFDLNGPKGKQEDDEAPEMPDITKQQNKFDNNEANGLQNELLQWHHKLGHISMKRIQKMAAQGRIPSRLARCNIPMCQACLYGMMKRKPWRSKEIPSPIMYQATKPGECVSVDQLESPIPGIIAQVKGIPTRARFRVATIFVDHYSDLSYVHFQQTTNSEETLKAKLEFERFARSYNVDITHYHADNGRFAELTWSTDALMKGQRMSYSGVGAHHQNGRAEKRIRDLQDLARSSLLHANKRWPTAIDARLWPYAMRKANGNLNESPHPTKLKTPLQLFSKVDIHPSVKDEHPFGCPMYVLDSKVQTGMKAAKWASRARLAIYLGPSIHHSKSVGLALSLTTGLVSPQFHAKYDDKFETVMGGGNNVTPPSKWQEKCGFTNGDNSSDNDQREELGHLPPNIPREMGNAIETNPEHHDNNTNNDTQQTNLPITAEDQQSRTPTTTTRSGRQVHPPRRYDDFVTFETTIEDNVQQNQQERDQTIHAMAASSDPDVLYLHEAMQQPDRPQFLIAMKKEIQSQTDNGNWIIVERISVPRGHKILPSVWLSC